MTKLAKWSSTSTGKEKNATRRWISWLPVAPLYPYSWGILRKPEHRAECWIIVTFCVIAGLYRELAYAYKDSFPVEHESFASTRMIHLNIPPVCKTGGLYSSSHKNANCVESPRFISHCFRCQACAILGRRYCMRGTRLPERRKLVTSPRGTQPTDGSNVRTN